MALEIEDKGLFDRALQTGINLFLGAGFSKLASSQTAPLPLGGEFEKELRAEFSGMNLPEELDLSTICTIIKSQQTFAFRDFCSSRFKVSSYDQRYKSLLDLHINNIFTTNIDNLIPKIIADDGRKYLHDIFISGSAEMDSRSIKYFALHGCVDHSQRDYVFGTTEIASAYGDDPQLWNYFAQVLSTSSTLFWGYGMRDAGTLQAVQSASRSNRASSIGTWILLRPEEKKNEAYYKALNFSVIYGETADLLNYIANVEPPTGTNRQAGAFSAASFPEYQVPAPSTVPVRESSIFFEGAEPSWYDIFQNIPAQTSHFRRLDNTLASGKSVLIQGVAASGKTTLLRMLACTRPDHRRSVLYVSGYMEEAKAEILAKAIGDEPVTIFWDNVFDTAQAVLILQQCPHVQLVAADRDYIYQFGFHRIDMSELEVYDCSDLLPRDIQLVVSKIPAAITNTARVRELERKRESVSTFDVIQSASVNSNITDRIRKIFTDLSLEEDIYKELFVLISYFHNARVPASFDAVASYCGLSGYGVLEVLDLLKRLGGLVKEYEGAFADQDQDYFAARSQVFAESCMDAAPPLVLRKVISRVLKDISIVKIPHYSVFQRGAFRNELFAKAFPNWRDGLELYELMVEVALSDRPKPYIKQQCALYLAQKGQYGEAFAMIDDAVRMSRGRLPTIRHTQARIKFEANIEIPDDEAGYVYNSLFDSMADLEDCRNLDIRKQRHSEYFARFALQLDDRYGDEHTHEFVRKAERWLTEEMGQPGFNRRLNKLLINVRARLSGAETH